MHKFTVSVFFILFFTKIHAQQQSKGQLSQARYDLAAAAAGTKFYFAGGSTSEDLKVEGVSNRIDIYDKATKTWSIDTLSIPRSNVSAASIGTMILFAGGTTSTLKPHRSDRVDVLDTKTNTWSKARLSIPRSAMGVGISDNLVFFAGGNVDRESNKVKGKVRVFPSDVVDMYDKKTGTWSSAKLSQARTNPAVSVVGDSVFFSGGADLRRMPSKVIDIYNLKTKLWTWKADSLSVARTMPSSVVVGNKAYIGGGLFFMKFTTNQLDIYNRATKKWKTDTLLNAKFAMATTSYKDNALFIGGTEGLDPNTPSSSETIEIIDVKTDAKRMLKLSRGRARLAAATLGTTTVIAGGMADYGKACSEVDFLEWE
jgi:N-acetylneuraminic acid mutarotase